MKFSLLRSVFTIRRLLRTLDRIALAEEQQATFLARLAEKFAPSVVMLSQADLKETGPSYGRDADFVKMQEFIEKCRVDLKREPTEEEIVEFLDGTMSVS